ncbi:MAG: hypothetical protein L0229_18795 [Blastocatellia bacterium]|nr:hypothetical protein [Blastocatellia bacterium]
MENEVIKEELLTRYLLGQLSDEEQKHIEEDYFVDDESFERLLAAERDLIDAYVRGELSEADGERFENYFLCTEDRRERVELAREWRSFVARVSAARPKDEPARLSLRRRFPGIKNPWVLLPLAATVLLLLGAGWLMIRMLSLNLKLEQMQQERAAYERKERELEQQVADERQLSEQLRDELERTRRDLEDQSQIAPSQSSIVSFVLSLGLTRGEGGGRRLVIPPHAKQVRLQLRFNVSDYSSYSASIEDEEGRRVLSRSGLKALSSNGGKRVVLTVPVGALGDEDYILTLGGVASTGELESVAEYSFSVVKKRK